MAAQEKKVQREMDNAVEVIRRGRNDEDKEQSLSGNHTVNEENRGEEEELIRLRTEYEEKNGRRRERRENVNNSLNKRVELPFTHFSQVLYRQLREMLPTTRDVARLGELLFTKDDDILA